MIKLSTVMQVTGLGRSSIYNFIQKGEFPSQVKLGQRSVAWVEKEVNDWLDARILARDQ